MKKIIITSLATILLLLMIGSVVGWMQLTSAKRKWKKFTELRPEAHKDYLDGLKAMTEEEKAQAPNVIVILTDDLGWGDIGPNGNTVIRTPHLDALAEDGVVLENTLAPSAISSPSRFGMLTGRYPSRGIINGVFFPSVSPEDEDYFDVGFVKDGAIAGLEEPPVHKVPKIYGLSSKLMVSTNPTNGILPDEVTMPEILQTIGYKTGMFGKWHLGDKSPHLPNDKGFEYFIGTHYSNDMMPYHYWKNKEKIMDGVVDQTKLTEMLTNEIVSYIEENAEDPFFVYYPSPFPHHPATAGDAFRGKSEAGLYGDCVEELDWSLGRIVETLKEKEIYDNTIIVFTSDNGPWYQGSTADLRGRKGNPYNGGQLVPMVVSWPAEVEGGRRLDGINMHIDLLPTIAAVLDVDLPSDRIIDGRNMLPMLQGEERTPHDELFFIQDMKAWALVTGDMYKYYGSNKPVNAKYSLATIHPFLFDISKDRGESYDLRQHMPETASELRDRLAAFNREMQTNPRGWLDHPAQ